MEEKDFDESTVSAVRIECDIGDVLYVVLEVWDNTPNVSFITTDESEARSMFTRLARLNDVDEDDLKDDPVVVLNKEGYEVHLLGYANAGG